MGTIFTRLPNRRSHFCLTQNKKNTYVLHQSRLFYVLKEVYYYDFKILKDKNLMKHSKNKNQTYKIFFAIALQKWVGISQGINK